MLLAVPPRTEYDWNFRLLGIPVRIHPLFWLVSAAMGWAGNDFTTILIWVGCVFVSIMVHEYGHAITARSVARENPSVILYAMGGLCTYDREPRSLWRKLAILLMGPGAGFLFLIVFGLIGTFLIGYSPAYYIAPDTWLGQVFREPPSWVNDRVDQAYWDLTYINFYWGLFNLLPIYPLDGGQISLNLFNNYNEREGARRCHILSIGVAAVLATYLFQQDQRYAAFFVAYLAFYNVQAYQVSRYAGHLDSQWDDQWWRR